MKYNEAKDKFLQAWGTLGSSWGISRTMSQIHALLLISPEALSAEDVMEELKISRGNANMSLRDLMDWGIVYKELKAGERKEFFVAEKDIWKVAKQVIKERRRRELEPVLKVLESLKEIDGQKSEPETKEFVKTIKNLEAVVSKADYTLDKLIKIDENIFTGKLLKLFK